MIDEKILIEEKMNMQEYIRQLERRNKELIFENEKLEKEIAKLRNTIRGVSIILNGEL